MFRILSILLSLIIGLGCLDVKEVSGATVGGGGGSAGSGDGGAGAGSAGAGAEGPTAGGGDERASREEDIGEDLPHLSGEGWVSYQRLGVEPPHGLEITGIESFKEYLKKIHRSEYNS